MDQSSKLVLIVCVAAGCGGMTAQSDPSANVAPVFPDSTGLVPAGFGTLRQDDIAIRLDAPGLEMKAIPLGERIIRLLTPDSYRILREMQESNRRAISEIVRRNGARGADLWYVSFFGIDPDTRFTPLDLVITSGGRDFRPLDVIPLSSGWGEERLHQRETQSAIYVFDGEIDTDHPLTVRFATERDESWEQILQRIERERALVRARAGHPDR